MPIHQTGASFSALSKRRPLAFKLLANIPGQTMTSRSMHVPFATEAEVAAIGEGLLTRTLPKEDWTHAAHCTAAVYLLKRRPDLDLPSELPGIIRAYNEATGVPNSDTDGYHETITQFYIRAVRAFLARVPHDATLADTCNRLIASSFGERNFPLRFYSRDRLFSVEGRRGWLDPDLQPLEFDDISLD